MRADEIIAQLDTLTAADLQRVLVEAQRIAALHAQWADRRNYQTEVQPNGTYVQERVLCGKPGCKSCKELGGHGPYWYHYTSENGRTKKRYIGKHKPEGT